ncbi:MAG: deoxyhypusine synthase family protein [Candidatus Eisenbacteria bacterium]|uniref:Deoxyhypusine synthase family protein n=1 Tax=Eiseniibacteriota bacterium TaxID=2212470 RepID=A0A938BM22_UNCEI|nr:deoxyhypusine synthase family protein [Candidatus Eisenbacteria bacterium]
MPKHLRAGRDGDVLYADLPAARKRHKQRLFAEPVRSLALGPATSVADLVEAMAGMSIQARNIGRCAQVLKGMYADRARPTVMLGLAGPLIAAGLRKVIRDLVDCGAVDVVVSTGAVLYQDIYQARGFKHYQGSPQADDVVLRSLYIDRIYDTYVDEQRFWETDHWVGRVADRLEPGIYSSRQFLDLLADQLDDEESIVVTCRRRGVPMFAPALNDSSIGIGLTDHRLRALREGRTPLSIDSIQDNHEILQIVVQSPKTAAIYVAGGVPKNYINDSIVMGYLMGLERGHDYAIQVTTAVTADGGLSSSTLSEAQSWGKIDRQARFAMAWVEPSVSLPLLAGYIRGRDLTARRPRLEMTWSGCALASLRPAKPARRKRRS